MSKFGPVIIHHPFDETKTMRVKYHKFLGLEAFGMIREIEGRHEWWPRSLGGQASDEEYSFDKYDAKHGIGDTR